RHLFRVACGLNSQVLGEPQIVGQVRDALTLAARYGGSGPVTERLLDAALRCAKRGRTETGIGRAPISSVYAAVNLAAKVLGHLGTKRALVIGSGEMAGLAMCHLVDAGVGQFTIAARNRGRAESMAAHAAARVVSLEAIPVVLPGADIVVCATAAPGFIVMEAAVRAAMKIRKNRPLLLLDLAVPRDVDPLAARLPNVFLHDLDALDASFSEPAARRNCMRIGTPGSALALAQSEQVRATLAGDPREHRLVIIKTLGDLQPNAALARIGGKGVFTKEIEVALLRNEIDI